MDGRVGPILQQLGCHGAQGGRVFAAGVRETCVYTCAAGDPAASPYPWLGDGHVTGTRPTGRVAYSDWVAYSD